MKFNMLPLSEAFESMDKEFSNGFDTKNKLSESHSNFVDKNSLSVHTKNALKTIIKDWYIKCFPDDELGVELYDNFTFEDLVDDLGNNVFDYGCCADDSVVRERVFQELANILKVDYDVIYYRWINTDDKPEIKEGLKETLSHPWNGLKGQEKLDAIKKFCAENPSLDPARVLCSDDGLARVEEEPIIIGDYKFVQDGRAWDVYKNDKFLYTGTRAAVCRQISDLWEKDLYKTETFSNESVNDIKESVDSEGFKYRRLKSSIPLLWMPDWVVICHNIIEVVESNIDDIKVLFTANSNDPYETSGEVLDLRDNKKVSFKLLMYDSTEDILISVDEENTEKRFKNCTELSFYLIDIVAKSFERQI